MNILLIIFMFAQSLFAAETSTIYGKIRKTDKTVSGLSFNYFITFEHQGKLLAYPVDTKSKEMAKNIMALVDQDALIVGDLKMVSFQGDGQVQKIETFVPTSISKFELSSIGVGDYKTPEILRDLKESKKEKKIEVVGMGFPETSDPLKDPRNTKNRGLRPSPGVQFNEVNDKVANGLIYTGAAAMLGLLLFGK